MNDDAQLALKLLAEHGPRLHALLLRITLRHDAAEDLMQELFLRLSRRRALVQARDPVGLAVTTATRLAFDWRRNQHRRRDKSALVAEPASDEKGAAQQLEQREHLQAVLDAIDRLPAVSRDVIVMRYLENQTYDQIAAALDRPVHHVRSMCHKAIVRLRRTTTRPVAANLKDVNDES